ncbi:MAG: AMP-binding protein, partial [Candidatus Limisoma sp.]
MTVDEFLAEWRNDDAFVTAHTSGSTGTPKEIRLLKADMLASARATNARFGIGAHSRLLLCLSPDYIAGKMMLVRAIEADAEIVEQKPSNEPMAGYDSNRRVSLLAVVPSQLGYLINHPEYLSLVDTVIIGGGALSERIEHWLADKGVN